MTTDRSAVSLGAGVASLCALAAAIFCPAAQSQDNPALVDGFPVTLGSGQFRWSSVALGDLTGDGVPEIVIGTTDGVVHAYKGTDDDGSGTVDLLWSYNTGDAAVESKAAIADIDGDGKVEVVVGVGSTVTPDAEGKVVVLQHEEVPRSIGAGDDLIIGRMALHKDDNKMTRRGYVTAYANAVYRDKGAAVGT